MAEDEEVEGSEEEEEEVRLDLPARLVWWCVLVCVTVVYYNLTVSSGGGFRSPDGGGGGFRGRGGGRGTPRGRGGRGGRGGGRGGFGGGNKVLIEPHRHEG